MQTTGLVPSQTPDWQVSVWVQALPSSQELPVSGVTAQPEVPSQVRVLQASFVQETEVPVAQVPWPLQVSP